MEFTYEQLLSFGTAMSVYFVISFPVLIIKFIEDIISLVRFIKRKRVDL